MKAHLKTYLFIAIGALFVAISYYFMFLPLNIVIGGVTGITVILNGIFGEISSGLAVFILNMFFLAIGLIFLGKDFFIKTLFGSLMLPFFIWLLEISTLPPDFLFTLDSGLLGVTTDVMNPISKIVFSIIFGSILTGVGLGLCFRVNATTGGMDIVQKIISKYLHFPYSKTVYFTDGIVVLVSFFVFGIEMTMYNLISIYIIGIFIDLVHIGGATRRSVFILSKKNDEIKKIIIERLERGVTVVPSIGGYSGDSYEMLLTTLSRNESYLLKDLIYEIDPTAFTFFVSAKEVYGDGFE